MTRSTVVVKMKLSGLTVSVDFSPLIIDLNQLAVQTVIQPLMSHYLGYFHVVISHLKSKY